MDGREEEAPRSVEAAHASTMWWAAMIGRSMQGGSTVVWRRPGREAS